MNWFKRVFGKRDWKTIYSKSLTLNCDRYNAIHGWNRTEVNGFFILKVDMERGYYQCYLTDGEIKTYIDLSIAVLQYDGLDEVLKQYDLTF